VSYLQPAIAGEKEQGKKERSEKEFFSFYLM
jgi:hypothetical protein